MTANSPSVRKYVFISSVAVWVSIIYSTSFSILCAEICAIDEDDEDVRSISIARIIYEKKVCRVIFLE